MTYQPQCYRCKRPGPDVKTRHEHGFVLCDACAEYGSPSGTPNPPPKHTGRNRWLAIIDVISWARDRDADQDWIEQLALDHDRAANDPPLGASKVRALVAVETRKAGAA